MIYRQITHDVSIEVKVSYVPPHRRPPVNTAHFWAYQITITNLRAETIQLLTRHWDITDGHGHTEAVDGDGVIGEQPFIAAGEDFEYSSACPLETSSGTMGGYYIFETEDFHRLKVTIPTFSLHLPMANKTLN